MLFLETDKPIKIHIIIAFRAGFRYHIVDLEGAALVFTAERAERVCFRRTARVTPEQWTELRATLDDIWIWGWRKLYECKASGGYDGIGWVVEINYPDCSIDSYGSDSYPQCDGTVYCEPEMTPAFEKFMEAIRKLVGMDFGIWDKSNIYQDEP